MSSTLIINAKTRTDNDLIKSLLQKHSVAGARAMVGAGVKYLIIASKAIGHGFYSSIVSQYADIDEYGNILDYVIHYQESTQCRDDLVVLVDTRKANKHISINTQLCSKAKELHITYIHVQDHVDLLTREEREQIDEIYCNVQGLIKTEIRKLYSYSKTDITFEKFSASLRQYLVLLK